MSTHRPRRILSRSFNRKPQASAPERPHKASGQPHCGALACGLRLNEARCGAGTAFGCLWLVVSLLCLRPSSVSAEITQGPPRIRNVYIPADQLELLFGSASKGVFMPRDKILALWQEAQRHGQPSTEPPADAMPMQASYDAHLTEHELRITGRIQIAKLRGGWQTVDLPFGGLAIESAQLGGQPARFGRRDDGTLFLLLEKEGRAEMELEMSAPLASKGGDLAATLKLPPVPASEMTIRLDEGKQLHLGETVLEPDSTENGRQVFRVAVDPTGLVPLLVSDRLASGNRSPLVLASSRSIGHVEPAGLRWEVTLDLDVYARATDTFRFQLPGSVDIAEVDAPQLDAWSIQQQADGTAVVALTFRKPLLGRHAVRLLGLAPAPMDKPWDLPTVKVLDAASHVGRVLLHPSPSLRVEVGGLTGIRPERLTDTSAQAATANGRAMAFAFWDENFRLPLRAIPRQRLVQASVATLVEVTRAGLELRGSISVEPRHAPLFGIELQLPRDWEVTSVLSGNTPMEWESVGPPGTDAAADAVLQKVRFDLAKPLDPGESLPIALTAQRHPGGWLEQEEGWSELPLPELGLAGADEVEGTVLVQAPPDIELLVSDLSDDLQPVAADRSQGASTENAGTALQYRYQDDARVSGRLQVRTVPAKVSAETLAFVRLDRGKLDVHYQLDLHIRHGKMRQIRFTLPAAVGEKIQVTTLDSAARVIEQQHTPLPDAGGDLTLWQVVLDRPVTGDLTLTIDLASKTEFIPFAAGSDPLPADSTTTADPIPVPILTLQNILRQSGIVALEAAGDQQIDYQPENLRDLDPADVPKPKVYVPHQRIVAAYQYPRLPYKLTISATRHPSESPLTAICESAEMITVAAREGRMRHQARFRLRSLNLQHVPVRLPDNADLWTVLLDGDPVEVRRNRGECVVPLSAGEADSANGARDLTLLYETESPRLTNDGLWGQLWPQTIRQTAPEIGVTTLATTWYVHPPHETDVVSAGGEFQPVPRLTRPTLVARLAEAIAEQSTTGLAWKFGSLVAAFVLVGFFALVSTGTGCQMKLVEIIVVISVIGILIALLLPATQSARESGRRATCLNNLKQIGLALLNYEDVYGQFPPAAIGPDNVPRNRQFSWMVAILPFLEQSALYDMLRLDLPWDHPHNMAVLQTAPTALFCPSDPAPKATLEGFPKSSYVAVTGADSTLGSGNSRGVIGFDRGLRVDEVVDGTSNTILVAEATDGGPWFAAGAGTARRIDEWIEKRTWSHHPGGGVFLMADGSVQFLSSSTNPQTLRHMATAQGLDKVEDEDSTEKTAGEAMPAAAPEAAPPSSAEPAPAAGTTEDARRIISPAPAPQEQSSVQIPPPPYIPRGERASLSLRVTLERDGEQAIAFRREGGPGELLLGLQDRSFARSVQWLLVAALLLAAWVGRRAPAARRAIAFVVGLTVPIGLSGLVPLALTPLLDGILLGTLAAGGLWMLLNVVALIQTPAAAKTAAMVILISLALAARANAAEDAPAVKKAPAAAAPARRPDLTLFIPYGPDDDDPRKNTQVYLPHDEFLRLWKKAHPEEPVSASPDVRAMVSHAEYSGRLENDVARFDGRILIHHLDDQWVRIALPLGDVALEKIEINGGPATLAGDAGGQAPDPSHKEPAIYLEQPGMHVVDVRFGVPVSRLGATGRMTVPLRAVPSGRLLLELPAEDLDVQVSGSAGGWRRQTANSHDVVSIPLGAAGELSIRWQPRRAEARAGQLVSVDHALLIEVLDSGLHLHSRFQYRIQQGTLGELVLRIPPELAVQSVQGSEVADWSIETDSAGADPGSQRLVVMLKTEVTTGTEVDIRSFRRDRQVTGPIDIRAPEPLGVVRETGRMAIGCSNHYRVRVAETDRVDQVNRMGLDLPQRAEDGCALLSAYRYTSRPWRLQLHVERHQARIEISDRTAVGVTARQATLRSLLTAEIAGAPAGSFVLRLPASLRVSRVQVPPGADWFLDRDGQGQRLKVELSEPAVGKLEMAVNGSLVRDSSQAEFVVPVVVVEEVQAQRGQLAVALDEDLEAVLAGDGGARPIDPAALDSALRPADGRPVHYAFQYDSPPEDLRLRLSPAPSRLNGDVITVVSVREGAVAYLSQVGFEVRQAARSTFRVLTPQWLGDDIELRGEHVRQVRSQAGDEGRTWEIDLQQPVRGTYRLQLVQTLPLPDDGAVTAPIIRPLEVERSRSHLVLENLTADEIAATTTRGAAAVSMAAVPEGLTDSLRRQAVGAYRMNDDAAVVAWQRRVRQQETGLSASINLADLTTVVHADGSYCTRAAYNIRNFTLQFLELELPPKSRIWSVHVSGQPVRPAKTQRHGRPITLLPLEKTSAGDFSSKVVVTYAGELREPLHLWADVQPPAPRIVSEVPVSRTLWTVLFPREYQVSLLKGQSNLEEVAAAYQQEERKLSFLDELRQMMQVASSKSGSAARSKAQFNLKKVGSALQDYAQQSAQVEARNAAEVQEQAQQIEAEIKRLEELKTDTRRADGDASFYFDSRWQLPTSDQSRAEPDQGVEQLPGQQDHPAGGAEQRRDKLREQAAEQLEKLQTVQPSAEESLEAKSVGPPPAVDQQAAAPSAPDGQAPAAAPGTGALSLDMDMAFVGTAYHFRKLHGEPRLVLRARHEDVRRGLLATLWAGLSLAMAAATVHGLRRPNAAVLAYRGWPWLAAIAGIVWLFLLPAGVFGLALLVTAMGVLVARSRQAANSEAAGIEPGSP